MNKIDPFASIYLRIDDKKITIQRTVIDFITIFGLLGGIYEIVKTFFAFISDTFTSKFFYASKVKRLYHIRMLPDLSQGKKNSG